jgi:hypothetical protein
MWTSASSLPTERAEKKFDVVVTDAVFGDILSDAAAMLTGSSVLPSASLNDKTRTCTSRRRPVTEQRRYLIAIFATPP